MNNDKLRMLSIIAQLCSIGTFIILLSSLIISYVFGANLEIIGFNQSPVKYYTTEIDLKIYNFGWQPAFVVQIRVLGDHVDIISIHPNPPFVVYPHKDITVKIKLKKYLPNVERYTNITLFIFYRKNSILFSYDCCQEKCIIDWFK